MDPPIVIDPYPFFFPAGLPVIIVPPLIPITVTQTFIPESYFGFEKYCPDFPGLDAGAVVKGGGGYDKAGNGFELGKVFVEGGEDFNEDESHDVPLTDAQRLAI